MGSRPELNPTSRTRNGNLSATMETESGAYKAAKKKLEWQVENALGQGISVITAQMQGSLEQTRVKVCLLEDE